MSSEYEQLKRRLDESCHKEELQRKAIEAKRTEKRAVRKSGGGKELAKKILAPSGPTEPDTSFNHGYNESNDNRGYNSTSDSEGCMGAVECIRCRKFHGYCREVEEKIKMLPTGNESQPRINSKKGSMDWLKNEELSTSPKEAKILMVRYNKEGRFGARVEIKLAFEGKIRYVGVPPKMDDKNPNYRNLTSAFGHDENNWVEKVILLSLEQDGFSNQYFLRIDVPNDEKPSARKNTASRGSGR